MAAAIDTECQALVSPPAFLNTVWLTERNGREFAPTSPGIVVPSDVPMSALYALLS
jgi:hypothetical protein